MKISLISHKKVSGIQNETLCPLPTCGNRGFLHPTSSSEPIVIKFEDIYLCPSFYDFRRFSLSIRDLSYTLHPRHYERSVIHLYTKPSTLNPG